MTESEYLETLLQRYRGELNSELRAVLGDSELPLYRMLRYHLGWVDENGEPAGGGGKTLRPLLCLLACEAVGGDYRQALPVAAALELVHNFSLIHDDIEDRGEERHRRPTVWKLWGEPQAINAGDAMHVLAHHSLWRLEQLGTPLPKILHSGRLLDHACLLLCEGQYMDLSYESRLDIGVSAYLDMIVRKTATLIECSLQQGALLGCDDDWLIERFKACGRKLGLAFQIRDDILGIWGKSEQTGKSAASDIQTKKKSLPIIYAFERATGKTRARLLDLYQRPNIDDAGTSQVLDILNTLGTESRAQELAAQYYAEALAELDATGVPAKARAELKLVAAFMVQRAY